VAPRIDYVDRVTGKSIPAVTTAHIYKGAFVFIILQVIMLAVVIAFPALVTGRLDKVPVVNMESIKLEAEKGDYGPKEKDPLTIAPQPGGEAGVPQAAGAPAPQEEEDPMEAVRRAIEQDAKGGKK
jgi:hypothetical protein